MAADGERLIDAFGTYLRHELAASPHTIKAYVTDVRQLAVFLAARRSSLVRADVHGVRAYLASLAGTGVTAYSVHPGSVATRFGYNTDGFLNWGSKLIAWTRRTPEKGAETVVYLCVEPEPAGASGDYFFDLRAKRTSRAGNDLDLARRLWEASARVTGLAPA